MPLGTGERLAPKLDPRVHAVQFRSPLNSLFEDARLRLGMLPHACANPSSLNSLFEDARLGRRC